MEYGSRIKYILLTLGAIILLVLSVWGIASIAKNLFSSNTTSSGTQQEQKVNLTDYQKPNTVVKLTVEGPIVADENFNGYEIEVAQDFRQMTYFKGFGRAVVTQKRYDNNAAAYESFMQALSRLGFANTKKSTSESELGACPTGKRYVYELHDLDEQIIRTWSGSCSTDGTFGGNGSGVRSLFKAQIPDAAAILKGTNLN